MLALKDAIDERKYLYDVCQESRCFEKHSETYITTENKSIKLCTLHYRQIADEVLW